MKTFVVLSDSHGRLGRYLERLSPLFAESDYIIFLGDGSSEFRAIKTLYPEKTYVCRGNCDMSFGEAEVIVEEEGVKLFCCHGHRYGVKIGLDRLVSAAKENGASVALYGHTHAAEIVRKEGVLCVNPGALESPVDASYCYLVLHKGKAVPTIVSLLS